MNVLLTPQVLTKLTLMQLADHLFVCRNMSTAYTSEFGKKGAKIGDTFYVRRPQRFQVTKGLNYQPQGISDTQVPISVTEVAGVHFEFDSVERTLSLDYINERYAKPAAVALSNAINAEAAKFIALNTFNAVGTPGSIPNTMAQYLAAEDLLVAQGCPQNEVLTAIINRKMSSGFISANGQAAAFNAADIISAQMRTGRVQNQLGYKWEIDQTIYTHVTGAGPATNATMSATASAEGGNNANMSISITGTGSNSTLIAKAGDVLTVAGSNSVHPQTRVDTSYPQQAVILQDVTTDSSGNATFSIFPAFTPQGQYQNVTQAATSGQTVTIWSGTSATASKSSPTGLLLHRDAFAFMSVPLEDPSANGVEMVAQETDPETGMTLSFIRAFDPISRKHINRFDTLYGFGRLYAELACRIQA